MLASTLLGLVACAPAQGAPAQTSDVRPPAPWLAQQVDGAMFFAHCGNLEAFGAAEKKVSLSRLANDPAVLEFLKSDPRGAAYANTRIEDLLIHSLEGKYEIPPDLLHELVAAFHKLTGAISIAVNPPSASRSESGAATGGSADGDVRGAAEFSGAPQDMDQALRRLTQMFASRAGEDAARRVAVDGRCFYEFGGEESDHEHVPGATRFAVKGNRLLFAMPTEDVMFRLLGPNAKKPLSDDVNFQDALKTIGSGDASIWAYVDGKQLMSVLDPEFVEGLRPLGLQKTRWAGISYLPDGDLSQTRLELRTEPTDSLLSIFTAKEREKFSLATLLPKRTLACLQVAVDGKKTFGEFKKLVAALRENGAAMFEKQMLQMQASFGTDLGDLARLVGDESALAVSFPEGGIIPDFYLLVRAKSADAAQELCERAEAGARRIAAKQRGAIVRELNTQSGRLFYYRDPHDFLVPTFIVRQDVVIVSSNVQAARRYIQFVDDPNASGECLASRADYMQSLAGLGGGPATGYAWIDWTKVAQFAYVNYAQFADMLGPLAAVAADDESEADAPESGDMPPTPDAPQVLHRGRATSGRQWRREFRFDTAKLPSEETILQYFHPQAIRFRLSPQGVSLESRAIF